LALGTNEMACRSTLKNNPTAICTWGYVEAMNVTGAALDAGDKALDAVLKGVAIEEANIKNSSVGYGGNPDRDGVVTLDACVMNEHGDYGAVLYVQNIMHVAKLARLVMEKTPHVILAGQGAETFAYEQGFKKKNLLTEGAKKNWEKWTEKSEYKPIINIENHDTIGMGLSYKMHGRVGDSPIIGAGLYVDNEVGAATATGMGEEVLKTVGSFLIVELMRQGYSPQAACEEAIKRSVKRSANHKDFQIGYIALNKKGETGFHSIHPGFSIMKHQNSDSQKIESKSFLSK